MADTRWWHSLAISFTIATWGLAQPLYGFIIGNDFFDRTSGQSILLFMLLYHGLPVMGLFLFDRLIIHFLGVGRFVRSARSLLFLAAALVFWREIQLSWDSPLVDWTSAVPTAPMAVLAIFVVVILGVLVIYWYRAIMLTATYLSVASLILTGMFVAQVGLLGDAWKPDATSPSASFEPPAEERDPVFLILFDGLGAYPIMDQGTIDESRFPNFAALANDSAVFTNATANYLSSSISIGSMMTGEFFSIDGGFHPGPSAVNSEGILATLRDSGRLVEFYSNHFECQGDGFFACLDGIPESGPNVHRVARDFAVWFFPRNVTRFGRDLTVRALPSELTLRIPFDPVHDNSKTMWDRFVSRISASQSLNKAYFVHSLLPHQPYEFGPDGTKIREVSAAIGFGDFDATARAYTDQVMYVDKLLGEFIARLKSEGLFDRSLIIVTGDHGPRSLGLGQQYSGFEKSDDYPDDLNPIILEVPLFIRGPEISPQVSTVDYQHIDLLPTVLEILDLPARQHLPGVSAFSAQRPTREKVFYGIPTNGDPAEKVTYKYDPETELWIKLDPR